MSTHKPHPSFEEDGYVLHDGCPRCEELGAHPVYNLSERYLAALWELLLLYQTTWDGPRRHLPERRDAHRVTEAEAKGIDQLWPIYLFLERHTPLDPKELVIW